LPRRPDSSFDALPRHPIRGCLVQSGSVFMIACRRWQAGDYSCVQKSETPTLPFGLPGPDRAACLRAQRGRHLKQTRPPSRHFRNSAASSLRFSLVHQWDVGQTWPSLCEGCPTPYQIAQSAGTPIVIGEIGRLREFFARVRHDRLLYHLTQAARLPTGNNERFVRSLPTCGWPSHDILASSDQVSKFLKGLCGSTRPGFAKRT
jgi:hypothetical protein